MQVVKNLVPKSKYNIKCPYAMNAEFLIVHNTANDASARNEIAYMIRNNNKVSFHYAIDDKEIVQGIPEDRNSWNAGDGGSGNGNRNGIAIEICYSKSGGKRFIQAEKNAAKFLAMKLKEKNWGINKVKKHQDFNGKYCPHRTLDMGWQRFLDMVQVELDRLNKPSTPSRQSTKPTTQSKPSFGVTWRNYISGSIVKDLQRELNKQFGAGLKVDGYFGDLTIVALVNVRRGARGNLTRIIQRRLRARKYDIGKFGVDGVFGKKTEDAVKRFQSNNRLKPDGIVGVQTWKALFRK